MDLLSISILFLVFLRATMLLIALYAIVPPSVCPSITRVDELKTVEVRIMKF